MKPTHIILALCAFAVPLVFRTLWFYQGIYQPSPDAAMPDFSDSSLPKPEFSTPVPNLDGNPSTGRLTLIDQYHGNLFNFSEIDALIDEIQNLGGNWDVFDNEEVLSQRLKRADSFIVIAPTSAFSDEEITAVKEFVDRGGRLLVFTDPTRNYGYYDSSMGSDSSTLTSATSTAVANLLLKPFGITIADDYLYNLSSNEGNYRHVRFSNFSESPLTTDLSEVTLYSAHSIQAVNSAVILADNDTFSSLTDSSGSLAAAVLAEEGRVAAVGDLSFLAYPNSRVSDNQVFIRNLATFLVENSRPAQLVDYPHLFKRSLVVMHDPDTDPSSASIALVADLQDRLRADGIAVTLGEKAKSGSDLLVVGTIPPSEEIEKMISDFDIQFLPQDSSENGSDTPEDTPSITEIESPGEPDPEKTPEAGDKDTPAEPMTDGELEERSYDEKPYSFDYFDFQNMDDNDGVMEIPAFGQVPISGVNLILFDPSTSQNKVFLLAGSKESIPDLLSRFLLGDLSGCLIQNNIAVCGSSARG